MRLDWTTELTTDKTLLIGLEASEASGCTGGGEAT